MPAKISRFHFPGKVWKMEVQPAEKVLAIEVRSAATDNPGFWVQRLDTYVAEPQLVVEGGNLWEHLAGYSNGVLVIQGYQEPGLPLPQGIKVFEVKTGKLRWEDPLRTFRHINGEKILAVTNGMTVRYEELDLKDGQPVLLTQQDWQAKAEQAEAIRFGGLHFPVLSQVGDPGTGEVEGLIRAELNVTPKFHLETLTIEGISLVAWYAANGGDSLAHNLSVWCRGVHLQTITLDPGATKLALDSFMVLDKWLIAHHTDGSLSIAELGKLC